jgi:hypothetical protein
LLNPAFCAHLLWRAASSHLAASQEALSIEETFLVLPFVLPAQVRDTLPRRVTTSLATWIDKEPLVRSHIVTRARALVPFTREALLFAGIRGVIKVDGARVYADSGRTKIESIVAAQASDEVRECAKRAEFLGKWFASAGTAATVLALVGVRP